MAKQTKNNVGFITKYSPSLMRMKDKLIKCADKRIEALQREIATRDDIISKLQGKSREVA